MPHQGFLSEHVKAHALDSAGGSCKTQVNNVIGQAKRFKDLSALVALQRRDPHLRHDLQHSVGHAGSVGRDDAIVIPVVGQLAIQPRLSKRVECKVRIDGVGTETDQQAEMMHFAGFPRFDQQIRSECVLRVAPDDDVRHRLP